MSLSKTLYIRGLQCPKSLWLKKNKPEVLEKPSAENLAVFDVGERVGELACELYPNGKKIIFSQGSFAEKIKQTQEWIAEGEGIIYEATFAYESLLVMVDILQIQKDGTLKLNEVKSSTSVKNVYLEDIAIQMYVLKSLGYEVVEANLICIDSSYVREEELEIKKLFQINNVTQEVLARQAKIPQKLQEFNSLLQNQNEPNVEIGEQCFDPYECDCFEYCWREQRKIPAYSVFNLAYLSLEKKLKLYHQGIIQIQEIQNLEGFSPKQCIQIQAEKSHQTTLNLENIKNFLQTLTYPIYHLDFETFQQAIPQWKGISAYMQIPFEYSIHIDDGKGGLEHREFLAQEGSDPRYALAKQLIRDIPSDAMILAYNMSFEKNVILNLAKAFEDLREELELRASHLQDLMIPFANKDYYHHKMQGSHSIKKVLPALVPEMQDAYQSLSLIHHGGEAMEIFPKLPYLDEKQRESYRQALKEYCKLDTLAMVKILQKLREVANSN